MEKIAFSLPIPFMLPWRLQRRRGRRRRTTSRITTLLRSTPIPAAGMGSLLRRNWARTAVATLGARRRFPTRGSGNSARGNWAGSQVAVDVPIGHGPDGGEPFSKLMATFGLGASSAFEGGIGQGGDFARAAPIKFPKMGESIRFRRLRLPAPVLRELTLGLRTNTRGAASGGPWAVFGP